MKFPTLTREALLDGTIREYIHRDPELRRLILSDAERDASLRDTSTSTVVASAARPRAGAVAPTTRA